MSRDQGTQSPLATPRKPVLTPDPRVNATSSSGKRVSFFVKLFVMLHVVAIASWSLPPPPKNEDLSINRSSIPAFFQSLGRFVSDGTLHFNQKFIKASPAHIYLMYTGMWQYWDMFSPNPASIDYYGTYTITYRNGEKVEYKFPRIYDMNIAKKYISERYRKFYERAHSDKAENMDNHKTMWPTFAQRVALLNYKDLSNPPVSVVLTRHFMYVIPPEAYEYQKLRQDWGKAHPHELIDTETEAALHEEARVESSRPWTPADYHAYNYYTYTVDQQRLAHDKAAGVFGS